MTNYNDGKWHVWERGPRPIHPDTVVQCVFDDGVINEGKADDYSWEKDLHWIAFRVIKEHKPAREWWCVMNHMFGSEDKAKTFLDELNEEHPGMNFGQVFHVREVLE